MRLYLRFISLASRLSTFALLIFILRSSSIAAEITGIPTPAGDTSSAVAINDHGQVAGNISNHSGTSTNPFIYENGHVTFLGQFNCTDCTTTGTFATSINNSGQIVGTSNFVYQAFGFENQGSAAFVYSHGQVNFPYVAQDGIEFLGAGGSEAYGINDVGAIVGAAGTGYFSASGNPQAAFVYTGGQYYQIGSDSSSYATAINNKGQVVLQDGSGYIYTIATGERVLLPSFPSGDNFSRPLAINDRAQIVGFDFYFDADYSTRAFLYSNGSIIDLGSIGSGDHSQAIAINNEGQIVGESNGIAFLYENGQMIDLNSFLPIGSGWVLEDATGINNEGEIVGKGLFDGQERGFILDASSTPEPTAAALLGVGIMLLGLIRAHSRRA